MKPGDVSVSDFVNSLLKAARVRGVSVVMIYGFQEHGRNKMVMSSNTGPAGTDAVLTWVRGLDPTAAAKALHDGLQETQPRPWDELTEEARHRYTQIAQAMLNAAAANAPRVKDPNEVKPS